MFPRMTFISDRVCSKFYVTGRGSKHEMHLILKLEACRKKGLCGNKQRAALKNHNNQNIVTTGPGSVQFFPSTEHCSLLVSENATI